MYATRERKLLKEAKGDYPGPIEKIERVWLIKLLYKPIDEVKKLSKEQLDRVIESYSLIGTVHDIVKSFKNTLFCKNPDELEKWIKDAEKLEIEQISSFTNGIRRDINAVKKAMELDYKMALPKGASIN